VTLTVEGERRALASGPIAVLSPELCMVRFTPIETISLRDNRQF
jgi:hypothetical protein